MYLILHRLISQFHSLGGRWYTVIQFRCLLWYFCVCYCSGYRASCHITCIPLWLILLCSCVTVSLLCTLCIVHKCLIDCWKGSSIALYVSTSLAQFRHLFYLLCMFTAGADSRSFREFSVLKNLFITEPDGKYVIQ